MLLMFYLINAIMLSINSVQMNGHVFKWFLKMAFTSLFQLLFLVIHGNNVH